jgi:CHAT domain-containing protein
LVTEAPQGSDSDPAALRATKWLADAHALVQVPSVQSMLLLRRFTKKQAGGDRFLGFGDPALEGVAQTRGGPGSASRGAAPARPIFSGRLTRSGTPMADVTALRSMARLPGTAEELKNMREALAAPPNSIFLGPQATEQQFRSMDLSNVSILALATHGLVAGEVDGAAEPGLVFTPPAEPSEQDDGFLTASEVAALRLNADWVILSACNTASGDGSEGAPGLSGLARAFFYAGARAMLASHWPVRDDVAARLTVRTVALRREQPTLSRAEAFQRAMREIREDASHDKGDGGTWAHPNAWAPFTLVGDAR